MLFLTLTLQNGYRANSLKFTDMKGHNNERSARIKLFLSVSSFNHYAHSINNGYAIFFAEANGWF